MKQHHSSCRWQQTYIFNESKKVAQTIFELPNSSPIFSLNTHVTYIYIQGNSNTGGEQIVPGNTLASKEATPPPLPTSVWHQWVRLCAPTAPQGLFQERPSREWLPILRRAPHIFLSYSAPPSAPPAHRAMQTARKYNKAIVLNDHSNLTSNLQDASHINMFVKPLV